MKFQFPNKQILKDLDQRLDQKLDARFSVRKREFAWLELSLWLFTSLTLFFAFRLAGPLNPQQDTPYDIVDFELAGDSAAVARIVEAWSNHKITNTTNYKHSADIARANLKTDSFPFIPLYCLTLILWLLRSKTRVKQFRPKRNWQNLLVNTIPPVLILIVIIAGITDYFENQYLNEFLNNAISSHAAENAATYAYLKFSLVFVVVTWIIGSDFLLIRHIWFALKPARYIILITFIFIILFFLIPQGKELFIISVEVYINNPKKFRYFILFALLSAFFLHLLYIQIHRLYQYHRDLGKLDPTYNVHQVRTIEEWVCGLVVFLPSLSFLTSYFLIPRQILPEYNAWSKTLPLLLLFSFHFIYFLIMLNRRLDLLRSVKSKIPRVLRKELNAKKLASVDQESYYNEIFNKFKAENSLIEKWHPGFYKRHLERLSPLMYVILLIIPACYLIWPNSFRLSDLLGPLGIIGFGLFTIMYLIFLATKLRKKFSIPVLTIVIMVWILFGFFNNNHEIRYARFGTDQIERESLSSHFKKWVSAKDSLWSGGTNHIILIAAEGGGIRAAYWTAGVLSYLTDSIPGLYERTYAASGVSGGSVGLAFFHAVYHDTVHSETGKVLEALGNDFLTPLVSAMLFGDLAKNFFPWPTNYWDRARRLEDSWSYYYRQTMNKSTMDSSFIDLWEKDAYRQPCLIFNTTHVETGRKAIYSNISLEDAYFPEAIDLSTKMESEVALKTGALLGARFPLVTPAALITRDNLDWGNVVDGGYYDNTGLESLFSVVRMIYDYNQDSTSIHKFKPVVLFLKNSSYKSKADISAAESTFTAANFAQTMYRSWGSQSGAADARLSFLDTEFNYQYIKIQLPDSLDNKRIEFPLGWTLAEATQKAMKRLIKLESQKELESLREMIKNN